MFEVNIKLHVITHVFLFCTQQMADSQNDRSRVIIVIKETFLW